MERPIVAVNANNENGIVKGEKIILNDESGTFFKTSDIESFQMYLNENPEPAAHILVCSPGSVLAAPKELNRYCDYITKCSFDKHQAFVIVDLISNDSFDIDNLETNLKKLKKYIDSDTLNLLSQLKNFSMSKTTEWEREVHQNGDYHFSVSMESSRGKKDKKEFDPPKRVSFEIPIYKHLDFWIKFEFNFEITVKDNSPKFSLIDLSFEEKSDNAIREAIEFAIKDIDIPKMWGNVIHTQRTDDWKYKSNPAEVRLLNR